jgi:hypothetical protein
LFDARRAIRTEIEEEERKSGEKFYGIAGIPILPLKNLLKDYFESCLPSSATTKAPDGEAAEGDAAIDEATGRESTSEEITNGETVNSDASSQANDPYSSGEASGDTSAPINSSATESTIKKLLKTSKAVKIAVIAVLCFGLGLLGAFLVDSILTNNDNPHDDNPSFIGSPDESPIPDEHTPTPTPESTPDAQDMSDEEQIIGTWEYTGEEMDGRRAEYIFADDYTAWMVAYEVDGSVAAMYEGVWSILDGYITISLSDGSRSDTGHYSLENDNLIIGGVVWVRVGFFQNPPELDVNINNSDERRSMAVSTFSHTVGLRSDGTVVAVGHDEYTPNKHLNVSSWTDIIAVVADYGVTLGLHTDGTVVMVGYNESVEHSVSQWSDIVEISARYEQVAGVRSDGTAVVGGSFSDFWKHLDISSLNDIVSVAVGGVHTAGLQIGGTVVTLGHSTYHSSDMNNYISNISDWSDIVAISAGDLHTVGLRSNGTVVAAGWNTSNQLNVSGWSDIIAISAGGHFTLGLRSDGTVVGAGRNLYGELDISDWTDIIAISAGSFHSVGLRSDGTVLAVGLNNYGQLDVSDWMLLVD